MAAEPNLPEKRPESEMSPYEPVLPEKRPESELIPNGAGSAYGRRTHLARETATASKMPEHLPIPLSNSCPSQTHATIRSKNTTSLPLPPANKTVETLSRMGAFQSRRHPKTNGRNMSLGDLTVRPHFRSRISQTNSQRLRTRPTAGFKPRGAK